MKGWMSIQQSLNMLTLNSTRHTKYNVPDVNQPGEENGEMGLILNGEEPLYQRCGRDRNKRLIISIL